MNYQGAFECHNCPCNADPENGRACPAWWETIWTQGEGSSVKQRLRKGCGLAQLPDFLLEVVKASNRPAAQVSNLQNEIAEGLGRINTSVVVGFTKLKQLESD